ncbi:MAG: transglutaminase domain-containing protein [Negativicutes bacterium]|jgi:hypothetical protein
MLVRLYLRIFCLGLILLIAVNCVTNAKRVEFSEARGLLSRDYAMAQAIVSGTAIDSDGEYWLTLFDKNGRFVRRENFSISKQPPTDINNYNDYYESVKFALKNFATNLTLTINDSNAQNYSGDIVKEVCDAYPSLTFGYKQSQIKTTTSQYDTTIELTFQYKFSKDNLVKMQNAVGFRARQIANSLAKTGMHDYELELAIHDYVVNNTHYDELNYNNDTIPAVDYTEYGVFVNGTAVCEGYAEAASRLLGMTGVPAMIISGYGKNGEAHAWNLVKIQNMYCHLDCTYDDPVGNASELGIVSHDYFNLSDKIIARDHRWYSSDYPRAGTMQYSFYNLGYNTKDKFGNSYRKIINQQELQKTIAAALSAHETMLTVDLMNTDKIGYDLNNAFNQAAESVTLIQSIGCKFLYTDSPTLNVRHLKITLEYN